MFNYLSMSFPISKQTIQICSWVKKTPAFLSHGRKLESNTDDVEPITALLSQQQKAHMGDPELFSKGIGINGQLHILCIKWIWPIE